MSLVNIAAALFIAIVAINVLWIAFLLIANFLCAINEIIDGIIDRHRPRSNEAQRRSEEITREEKRQTTLRAAERAANPDIARMWLRDFGG